jgi:uncharacterized protein (TIGR00266 family)
MEHEITHQPSFASVEVRLEAGEAISAEAGAMVAHSSGIEIETAATGGLMNSLKRSVLGGKSFFVNTFRATEADSVTFAPPLPGDVVGYELADEQLYVQSSSYSSSCKS